MNLRDIPKLQTGDIVECKAKLCGCDGIFQVTVEELHCGCILYRHSGGNFEPFAKDTRACTAYLKARSLRWGMGEGSKKYLADRITAVTLGGEMV